jgi:hypothetical protein
LKQYVSANKRGAGGGSSFDMENSSSVVLSDMQSQRNENSIIMDPQLVYEAHNNAK